MSIRKHQQFFSLLYFVLKGVALSKNPTLDVQGLYKHFFSKN